MHRTLEAKTWRGSKGLVDHTLRSRASKIQKLLNDAKIAWIHKCLAGKSGVPHGARKQIVEEQGGKGGQMGERATSPEKSANRNTTGEQDKEIVRLTPPTPHFANILFLDPRYHSNLLPTCRLTPIYAKLRPSISPTTPTVPSPIADRSEGRDVAPLPRTVRDLDAAFDFGSRFLCSFGAAF